MNRKAGSGDNRFFRGVSNQWRRRQRHHYRDDRYLMEISPDDQRPAYSGYFNALVVPAALLPLAGALIVETTSLTWVFAVSLGTAGIQFLIIRMLRHNPAEQF